MKLPESFSNVATYKVNMHAKNGFISVEVIDDDLISLKRVDPEYGSGRDEYYTVTSLGVFARHTQSEDLVNTLNALKEDRIERASKTRYPEDHHSVLLQYCNKVDAVVAEYNKAVYGD